MWPPEHMVKALQRLNPSARLAWLGEDRKAGETTLNKGCFSLLQLYTQRDIRASWSAKTGIMEPWGDRGPVFGKRWDPLKHTPMWLANFAPEEVFSGRFLGTVKEWMTPIRKRCVDSAKDRGKALQSQVQDLAGEMGEHMHWKAQKDGPVVIPNQPLTSEEKATLRGERARDMTDDFMRYVPGGARASA